MTTQAIIYIESDMDADAADADCYTPAQIEALRRGDWEYVGVIPVVEIEEGDASVTIRGSSLWSVEGPGMPITDEADEVLSIYSREDAEAYWRTVAADGWADVEVPAWITLPAIDWSTAKIVERF